MVQRGLDIKLWKKFHRMEFKDFYELAAKFDEYEELLMKELNQKRTAIGTYYQEVNNHELTMADLINALIQGSQRKL